MPKAKTLVSKFAGPQETIKRKLSLCNLTFVWMTNPLCFRCNHQYEGGGGGARGDRFRSKQDRKIKNNSINILPIVIREKEQHDLSFEYATICAGDLEFDSQEHTFATER